MYKRGNIWWTCINGVEESTGTADRKRAQTLETKRKHEQWDAKRLGIRFATWDQAVKDWDDRNQHLKALHRQREYARWWGKDGPGQLSGKRLQDISADLVLDIIRRNRPVKPEACPQNATANLHLAFVVKIMRHANSSIRLSMLPVSAGREQWLTVPQWKQLCMPAELRQVATFSLATGLRRANVIGLQWPWIQGKSLLIPSEFTKTGKVYSMPLNKTAQAVIAERHKAVRSLKYPHNVFLMDGEDGLRSIYPVMLHRAWNQCLVDSGIPHMPYHGLRHTYASWMVQAGVPFEIVARLGQWKTRGIVNRYSHFDVESLRSWAEKFDSIISGQDYAQRSIG